MARGNNYDHQLIADRILGWQLKRYLTGKEFSKEAKVIDVGCGLGRFTRMLARYFIDGEVMALDGRNSRPGSEGPKEANGSKEAKGSNGPKAPKAPKAPQRDPLIKSELKKTMSKFANVRFQAEHLAQAKLAAKKWDHIFFGFPEDAINLSLADCKKAASLLKKGGTLIYLYRTGRCKTEAERNLEELNYLAYEALGVEQPGNEKIFFNMEQAGFSILSKCSFCRRVAMKDPKIVKMTSHIVKNKGKAVHKKRLAKLLQSIEEHGLHMGWYEVVELGLSSRSS